VLSTVLGGFVMSDILELDPTPFTRYGAKLVSYLFNISGAVNNYNALAVQCRLFMSLRGAFKIPVTEIFIWFSWK